jgi:colicin import membrane protein
LPEIGVYTITYTAKDSDLSQTYTHVNTYTYAYDAAGRLSHRDYSDGSIATFTVANLDPAALGRYDAVFLNNVRAADLALKAKALDERKKREQAAREKKEADQREAAKKKLDEQRRLAEAREAETRERQRREAEALRAQAEREQGARAAQQKLEAEAAARTRDEADYIRRIQSKVKGNVILPPDMPGNPEAIFEVVQLPTGEIIDAVLRKSSGVRAYDDAVQRAIVKSSPLPRPDRPDLFQRTLTLKFRPQD